MGGIAASEPLAPRVCKIVALEFGRGLSMTIRRRRIPVGARRLLAVGALAFAVLIVMAALPQGAHAEPEASAEYQGATSEGGTALLVVSADRTTVDVVFSIRNRQFGCPGEIVFARVPIATGGGQFRVDAQQSMSPTSVTSPIPVLTQVASVVGYWDVPAFSAASGVLVVDPAPGRDCQPRRISWRAGRSNGSQPRANSGVVMTDAGSVFLAGTSVPGGTVQASTTEFGSGLQSFSFTYQLGECTYVRSLPRPLRYDYGPTFEYSDPSSWSFAGVASNDSIAGGIVVAGDRSCPTVALYYVAQIPRSAEATAPPVTFVTSASVTSMRGQFVNEPVFDETFHAPVVFTGGTVDELEGALLEWNVRSALVPDAAGDRWLLEAGITPSRDAFRRHFPDGVAPMTAMTLAR